ncbi:hypothetical protein SCHPADRAFT_871320 [Schizopora paradoxa]|uniref:Beta-glucuronidase C-terminal domain-containing protein n=1 Tax=Schizopora paradoxa TaxID=27342 RepID=A0A0H2RT98_9AGAM|nr:hypothetical protein SCHPADRAFT_871320 [Schizopora paradoxa]
MILLGTLLAFSLATAGLASIITFPSVSQDPTNASQILDRRLASFSFEFSYLPNFGGNLSNPNVLTKELMQRLEERTGVGPDIRPGGITILEEYIGRHSKHIPTSNPFQVEANDLYSGPAYYESLAVFPQSSRFIVDVNLGNSSVDIAQKEIQAAVKYIGWDRIYSLELGNEPDQYAGNVRPAGWTSEDYTEQFLNWTSELTERLDLPKKIFQAGAFAIDPTSSAPMTTVSIIEEGIDDTGVIKLFDQHTYQYSTCDPVRNAIATLPNLINHQNITAYLDLWKPQIAAAKSRGKEFVVGEYNSVSCSGKENVTDTFGQALWLADTILYGASINISRMYLHQGATLVFQSSDQSNAPGFSWYDLWYPVPTDRYGSARASPSFVAYLLVTEAVGSSGQSQLSLIDVPGEPQLAAYAIWDPAARKDGIARLALLNLNTRNTTTSAADAAELAVTVDVSKLAGHGVVTVKKMSSPGLDSKDVDNVLWAGQAFTNGTATGIEVAERVKDNQITIAGSEAALIFFA